MLKYYDLSKALIGGLKNCKDLKVESELSTGDKQLSFLWHINNKIKMCLECYIRTDTDEFVIKENSKGSNGYRKIVANLNLEDLEGKAMEKFEAVEHTVKECADMALSGTGWRCICTMDKRRGMKLTKVTALDVLNTICKAFLVEVRFDTINKIVYFQEEIGEDRGVYFAKALNLKEVTDSADTYDYFTQILPIGKDGLKIDGINGGKAYLENYQYSSKKKMLIWEDSRYETAEALKEDAQKKLAEMSKSKKSYQSKVIDLSKQNEKYSILSYSLGDTVTLIENETDLFEKQRIVKITEYLNDPTKNTCELSNTTLTFEEMQSRLFETADIVNNITEDNGTVKVYATDIKGLEDYLNGNQQIKDLTTQYLYVSGELGALKASFGEMQTTYLKATDAEITYLKVEKAEADYLKIDVAEANYIKTNVFEALDATVKKINGDFLTFKSGEFETLKSKQASFEEATAQKFTAANGNIDNLTGQFATFKELTTTNFTAVTGNIKDLTVESQRVKTLLAGNITAENIATGAITAGSGIIAQGAIGDAEISSLSANKIKSGTVDTSLVTIASKDSAITITGNQMMVNDTTNAASPINRVILGKYTNGSATTYGLLIRGKDGKTVMLDGDGVHNAGITNGAVDNNKVADDANISGNKLDINSVVRSVNGATEKIQSTVVQVGDRSLNVYLGEQTNTIASNYAALQGYANTKAADALKDAKSYADGVVNGISIGTRNLIPNTNQGKTGWSYPHAAGGSFAIDDYSTLGINAVKLICTAVAGGWGAYIFHTLNRNLLNNNTKYTLAFDVYSNVAGNHKAILMNQSAYNGLGNFGIFSTKANEWIHVELSCTTNSAIETDQVLYITDFNRIGEVIFANLQMVEGDKIGTWTPAPEDTQAQFEAVTTSLTEQSQKLLEQSGIINSQGQLLAGHTATIQTQSETLKSHEASIKANQDSIKLKVDTQTYTSDKTVINTSISDTLKDAKSYADTKKTEAVSAAATDAKTKADKALSDSKTFTNAEITKVNTSLSKATADITILQGQITSKVEQTDINKSVETVKLYVDGEVGKAIEDATESIKTAKSEIKQTTDAITQNVSNLQSTVSTHTTQIGNKAETSTVTAISNRTASLETKLTGITGKVTDYVSTTVTDSTKDLVTGLETVNGSIETINSKQAGFELTLSGFATDVSNLEKTVEKKADGSALSTLSSTVSSLSSNLEGFKTSVSSTYTTKTELSNTLGSYSTTKQMNSAIEASKTAITSSVSETYSTKAELTTATGKITALETWKQEASQKITKDGIVATVGSYYAKDTDLTAAENRITSVESKATQTADKFNWIVKSGTSATDFTITDRLISLATARIDLSASNLVNIISGGSAKIQAKNITLDGIVTANSNFKILADGSVEAVNGKFSGKVTTDEGNIGGWVIKPGSMTRSYSASGKDHWLYFDTGTTDQSYAAMMLRTKASTASVWEDKFSITWGGRLLARDVDITGTIRANNGSVAGFTINGSRLDGNPTSEITALHLFANDAVFEAGQSLSQKYAFKAHTHNVVNNGYFDVAQATGDSNGGTFSPTLVKKSGSIHLGYAGLLWSRLYAANATISTSDANEKTDIHSIDERYERMFMDLKPVNYRWVNRVSNDNHDRVHCGLVAQEVEASALKHGLSSDDFATICKDRLEVPTADGRTTVYGLAYSELHGLEIHMIQKNAKAISDVKREIIDTRMDLLNKINGLQADLNQERAERSRLEAVVDMLQNRLAQA